MASHRRVVFALLFAVFLFRAPVANAQLSAYVTPMFTGWGLSTSNSTSFTLSHGSGGIGGGAFYNFPIQSRLTAGIDVRGSDSFGRYGGDAFSASFRIGFVPHHVRLRPYFQLGGGVTSAPYTQINAVCSFACVVSTSSKRATNGGALIAVGLDIRLTQHFDLRALEYGAQAGATGTDTSPTSGFAFLSSGVVYHFHP